MEVISRKDAAAKGLKHFYTGKPCKRNHDRERAVATGACLGCLAHYAKEYADQFRAQRRGKTAGQIEVKLMVHPDHIGTITSFAGLLSASIVRGTPVPLVPNVEHVGTVNTMIAMMQPTTAPAPVVSGLPVAPAPANVADLSTDDAKHALWVRIHGKEIADQMAGRG